MIIAQVPVKGTWINVRVLDVFKSSRGRVAYVKALPVNGRQTEPFCSWTHGGWAYSSTGSVPIAVLRNVAIQIDTQSEKHLKEITKYKEINHV